MINKNLIYLFPLIVTAVSCSQRPVMRVYTERSAREILLGKPDPASFNAGYTISNDRRRIVYRAKEGDQQMIADNGVLQQKYDSVSFPVFSPDSKHMAYAAKEAGKWKIIADGHAKIFLRPGEEAGRIFFTGVNNTINYILKKNGQYFLVFGGVTGKGYDLINENSIVVTEDDQRVAYTATKNKKQVIVFNGTESKPYDETGFPVLRMNGAHLAYWAKKDNKAFVIIDQQQGKSYDRINSLELTKNADHYAYSAQIGKNQLVVADGVESATYSAAQYLQFSPLRSRLMYEVQTFEPFGEGFKNYMILDGKRSAVYSTIVENSMHFSPDEKHTVYEAEHEDTYFIVYDEKEEKHYGDILQSTIVFSPDNARLAYGVEYETKRFLVSGETEGPAGDNVSFVAFSPDSRRLAYTFEKDHKAYVVVDGEMSKAYDEVLGQGGFVFDANNRIRYMAMRDGNLYIVEENLK